MGARRFRVLRIYKFKNFLQTAPRLNPANKVSLVTVHQVFPELKISFSALA
jgi:hypothetical protein